MKVMSIKRNDISIGDGIKVFLSKYRLTRKFNEQKIKEIWPEVVGKSVANHTSSLSLRGSALLVEVDSSIVRNELHYAKSSVLEKLNEAIGEDWVDEIRLK